MNQLRRFRLALLPVLALFGLAGWRYHVMTQTVTSTITASVASGQTSTLAQGSASYAPTLRYGPLQLTDGTGNNQFKIFKADSGGIAASDSLLVDLAGSTADAFGQTITCTTMKGIMVTADSSNVNDVLVGGAKTAAVQFLGAAAADTTHVVPVGPGGVFLWIRPKTGTTVTAGTRDIVRLKNSGGTTAVKYKYQILCR
jgi:hypothetical protein